MFFTDAPIWLVALILFAVLTVAREIGFHAEQAAIRRGWTVRGRRSAHGLAAVLGLVALLISFTYSLALNRFELRRDLVVQEANAIASLHTAADVLEDEDRASIQRELRSYLATRLNFEARRRADYRRDVDAHQMQLAQAVTRAARRQRDSSFGPDLLTRLTAIINADATQMAAMSAQIPTYIMLQLLLFATLAEALLGTRIEQPLRMRRPIDLVQPALLALALALVFDLERPLSGAIILDTQPMLDLKAKLDAAAR